MDQRSVAAERERAGVVVAVCISAGGIPKRPVDAAEVSASGLLGDGHDHAKHWHPDRAVSIQDFELVEQVAAEGYPVGPGIMGENITVRGSNVQGLAPGFRLRFDGGPVLELTAIRKPCYVLDAIHPDLKDVVLGRCGFLCRVVTTGTLRVGQRLVVEPPRGRDCGKTSGRHVSHPS